jgi:ABC-type bacteriocin/lantibiotic exporter with double-glycine peptidase domain
MPKQRRRVPVVLQSTRFDCGPACLSAVLAAFGRRTGMASLRDSVDPGRDGVSALELRDEANRHGLRCTGRRVDAVEELARLPLPVIAHWQGDHYVVITRVGHRSIHLMDPAIGYRRLSHAEYLAGATGVTLTFQQTKLPTAGGGDRSSPRTMVRTIIRPSILANRTSLGVLGLTSLLLFLIGLVVPALTGLMVDRLAGPPSASRQLGQALGAVLALFAVAGVLTLTRGFAIATLQRRIGQALSDSLLGRLLRAPLQFVEKRGPGALTGRVLQSDALRDALASRLVGAVLDAVVGVAYLAVVVAVEPKLGLLTALIAVGQTVMLGALGRRGRRLRREELAAQVTYTSWLYELTGAMAWVKGAGAESIVEDKAKLLRTRQLGALYLAGRNDALAEAGASAVSIAGSLLLLVAAAAVVPGTAGRIVAVAGLAAAAITPLGNLATDLRQLNEIGSVLDHLEDLADAPAESTQDGRAVAALRGAITASELCFRFTRNGPWILRNVSFDLPAGAKLAIVGPSGSGKSTLAKLLVGLYQPTAGMVTVDDADIRELDLPSLRRLIGVVWQEPLLLSGSIHENIALRDPDAPAARVHEAARLAAIDTDIAAMAMRYETRLGSSGEGLSGGQRQRLALARALIGRPAILVLDEATSHLDTPTEARVERNLRGTGVTRIVVAHRLSPVQDADLILVLSNGHVIEQGTHQELIDIGGQYAQMVSLQRGPAIRYESSTSHS